MATVTVQSTTGSAYALLEQTWRPVLATESNEEMRIVDTFDDGNDGVEKIAGTLNIRKILRIPSTVVLSTAADAAKTLTYTSNTELNVQVLPRMAYGAVELSRATLVRLLAAPQLQKAYRKQIAAGIATQIDSDGGALATSLSTITRGGVAQSFDKPFLLDGVGALIENARDLFQPGRSGWAYLHYHPRQYKYVHAIPEIISANLRGDGEKVIKKGWVWESFGLSMTETGNVYVAAGIAHNLLHIKESHVIGYNAKPDFLSPQEFELVLRIIGFAEYGVGEVWDQYAADMQTSAA